MAGLIDLARDGVLTFMKAGMPVMLAALLAGLIVSLGQALTQIQEQTLVYVPKIVVALAALVFLLPYMGDALAGYMERVAFRIVTGG
ncbi:MAG TPA: flagellar biosynthetic protein FliQ [Beijerinckiaceae bacterium]|nr:flagellar biosynthetic protein FliQ [Beijerinckiaceae bacterium]